MGTFPGATPPSTTVTIRPAEILQEDHAREVYTITKEAYYRVQEIARSGLTWDQHRRLAGAAEARARLQGRVDVGVREIADKLRGL